MSTADTYELAELRKAAIAVLSGLSAGHAMAAWLSGSLVEGLGNPSSDVDIFVALPGLISEDLPLTRRGEDHGILGLVEGGVRYDVEYWPHADIMNLKRKLDQLPINDPQRNNLHFLTYWESEFIHRLLVGSPLLNEEEFRRLQGLFDAARFARYLMDTAIRRADDAFDDAVGMLRAGQMRMAALRARDALGFSADALLHAHGVTNDKTKFRLAKLDRLADTHAAIRPVADRLWRAEAFIPDTPPETRAYVEEALRFSSEMTERAQDRVRG
ncbi:MAG: nucleotidyltransferase domain-containing protein [Alphaproteobacteria bacterium]|nr:nucleotidyltransferase domain-containing protein [Alphaproteobacteria bacterium]MBF0374278.1 nucleotidyltransferase domain-containing protein [Alphaproteobacteria bacterium]